MKRLLFLLLPFLLLGTQLHAGEIESKSTITAVTVYRTMARETRTSTAVLPVGNSEVVISGVSMQMIDPSIQVAVKGDATLLSASVRSTESRTPWGGQFIVATDLTFDPKAAKIQDSISTLQLALRWIAEEQAIHQGELDLLSALLQSGTSQKEYKPADLNAVADIYRARTMELKKKLFDLQLRQENIEARIQSHEWQLAALGPKPQDPVKEIVLNFWSDIPVTIQIKSMYLVNGAGWTPSYDLNVESTSKPVAISYHASIFQTTGYDWKNVDLTVSTSAPGMNNDRPIMNPRYVDFVTYAVTSQSCNTGAVTNLYFSPTATNSMYTSPSNNPTTTPDPYTYQVNVGESDIHVDYDIDIKQNIPCDGRPHICKLQNYNVPAIFRYHTVPKLESAAFLLARITDYGQYNLLAGKANVFFEDTYVGQVNLNPQVTGDTLLVSLGRDEKIVVKRTRIQETTAKKIIGPNQKENFAYQITVRNNKGVPIDIEVLDQIPLSRKKEIIVDLVNKSGAKYEEDYGKILWHLKIDPNKSKTLDLVYTIESPQDKPIVEQ